MPDPDPNFALAFNAVHLDVTNVQTRLTAVKDANPDDPKAVHRRNDVLRQCRGLLRNAAAALSVMLDDLSDDDVPTDDAATSVCRSFTECAGSFDAVFLLGLLPGGGADVRKAAPNAETAERLFGQLAKRVMAEAAS